MTTPRGVELPRPVRAGVEAALARAGGAAGARVAEAQPLGGGCVSPAARLRLEDGREFFLKWGDGGSPPDLFVEEARSLGALAASRTVRVPTVAAVAVDWLLLEWLPSGRPASAAWAALGRRLAALHRSTAPRFGWDADNFIGPLPQANGWLDDWPHFWRDRRLVPQLERALDAGLLGRRDAAAFERLVGAWTDLLAAGAADGASLLHGDLWSGNVLMLEGGPGTGAVRGDDESEVEPQSPGCALVDPSCYYGHREVDLAMAALFGGFDPAFWGAYEEAWPLVPGHTTRRHIYQLYYLLVHVNLFGAGYVAGTRATLERALAAV